MAGGSLRMAKPTRRKGSTFPTFQQRIPADILGKVGGVTLHIPMGETTVIKTLNDNAKSVWLSLQTRDPAEAKARQAAILAYLAERWKALRMVLAPLAMSACHETNSELLC